jgi:hypothetical protein
VRTIILPLRQRRTLRVTLRILPGGSRLDRRVERAMERARDTESVKRQRLIETLAYRSCSARVFVLQRSSESFEHGLRLFSPWRRSRLCASSPGPIPASSREGIRARCAICVCDIGEWPPTVRTCLESLCEDQHCHRSRTNAHARLPSGVRSASGTGRGIHFRSRSDRHKGPGSVSLPVLSMPMTPSTTSNSGTTHGGPPFFVQPDRRSGRGPPSIFQRTAGQALLLPVTCYPLPVTCYLLPVTS